MYSASYVAPLQLLLMHVFILNLVLCIILDFLDFIAADINYPTFIHKRS
jgi:hypothetical protein